MPILANLIGLGTPAFAAAQMCGPVSTTAAGAGTTNADATLLPLVDTHFVSTAANNSGVILPPGNGTGAGLQVSDSMFIYNDSANTLLLYAPPLGQLNGQTVTSGSVSIPTKTSVLVKMLSSTKYAVSGPTT